MNYNAIAVPAWEFRPAGTQIAYQRAANFIEADMELPQASLVIRNAGTVDIEKMVLLLRELFSIEADFQFDAARERQGLKLMLASPQQSPIWVAQSGTEIVGMCSAQVLISTAQGSRAAIVEDLVVRKDFRSRGIGKALIKAVGDWAVLNSITRLQLLADRTNIPALEFYRHMGWSTTQLICLRYLV
jgi:GNAT superfamily N-acetyltransferase